MKLKNVKAIGAVVVAAALSLSLVACGAKDASSSSVAASSEAASSEATDGDAAEAGAAALGFGLVSNAGNGEGSATANTTVAAVLVDEAGVIVDVKIDVAQNHIYAEGGVVTTPDEYLTKQEKGDDYGMAAIATAGEWYEQMAAFTEYVIGMNAADVAAIGIDADTKMTTDEDLLAGCTIKVTDYVAALTLALEDATEYNSTVEDTLALATTTTAKVSDATADEDGTAQTDSTFVALVTGTDGVVSDVYLDVVQSKFTISADDVITGAGDVLSKQQLGADYGMAAIATAGEWFEQADAFTDYVVGMNAADIAGIEYDAETKVATDEDLLAGCTIKISSYVETAVKAVG